MKPETSTIAYDKYRASGKKAKDQEIILWVLGKYGKLTAFGIAKRAYYKVNIHGVERIKKLGYMEVSRRMAGLRDDKKVERLGKHKDLDGGIRYQYKLN